ncbi:MAG: hypothetical protein A3H98_09540 [Bacteroidetes bacterium RIFCSPLOWO2_02_FULL_36_8]|nr:MAG: hypothetical protein A3H98_09540 [Bacteroidetes bacterium RIFCSPLOWO2_02_FULL_36_8]OFY69270.1 MAG: hypothetical protein A3G23_02265 [Bacteroidetes bacterium RIFCSPLOWO2_12_FULL_37_12]
MPNHWLTKTDPETFSWDNLEKEGKTIWDGVRNYQARNNLKNMIKGDRVLIYESNIRPAVVGTGEVIKEYFQDPTTTDTRWVAVEIKAGKKFSNPVLLSEIRKDVLLSEMILLRNSRLSVFPVTLNEFNRINFLGNAHTKKEKIIV